LLGVSFSLLLMTAGMVSRNYFLHNESLSTIPHSKSSMVTATALVGHGRGGTATATSDDKRSYPVLPGSTGSVGTQDVTPTPPIGQETAVPDGNIPSPTQVSTAPTPPPQPSPTSDSVPIIRPTDVLTPTPTAMLIATPTDVPTVVPIATPTEGFSPSGYDRYSH
jgi:hypothetical protein